MVVVFCGHSNYISNIQDEVNILNILKLEVGDAPCDIFLGGYGIFDDFAFRCAKKFKQGHPNVKLIWITPYLASQRTTFEKTDFDSIIYPCLEHVPPRYAISHRNKWMIEQADVVICFVSHRYGGANAMYVGAKHKNKKIYNLGSLK